MVKVPLSITVQPPAFAVVLHNMAHVFSAMTESPEEASRNPGTMVLRAPELNQSKKASLQLALNHDYYARSRTAMVMLLLLLNPDG